jgi:hypothetical protein
MSSCHDDSSFSDCPSSGAFKIGSAASSSIVSIDVVARG